MKKTVCVIFGGASSEYEVSLMSSASIIRNLDTEKFDILTLGITKDGRWLLYSGAVENIENNTWMNSETARPAFISPDKATNGLVVLNADGSYTVLKVDVLFPVLHGKNGEDGTIQGLFKLSGIPYVGCGTLASAVCMDKAVTHTLLSAANIEQAHYLWFYADRYFADGEKIRNKIAARLNFPVFVKPANAGSSVGVSKVTAPEKLDAAIRLAAENDTKVVVEEGIVGQEVECAVLGNRGKASLPRSARSVRVQNSTIMTTNIRTASHSSSSRRVCPKTLRRKCARRLFAPTTCSAATAFPAWISSSPKRSTGSF